jgi:hypothetical protein
MGNVIAESKFEGNKEVATLYPLGCDIHKSKATDGKTYLHTWGGNFTQEFVEKTNYSFIKNLLATEPTYEMVVDGELVANLENNLNKVAF